MTMDYYNHSHHKCTETYVVQIHNLNFRFVRGFLTRKKLDKDLGLKAKGFKRIMNITREGRRRPASPSWRFEKGKVDINYSKLMSLLKSETNIKNGDSFLDISHFKVPQPDLTSQISIFTFRI